MDALELNQRMKAINLEMNPQCWSRQLRAEIYDMQAHPEDYVEEKDPPKLAGFSYPTRRNNNGS